MTRLKDTFNKITSRKAFGKSLAITYGSFAPYLLSMGATLQHVGLFYASVLAIPMIGAGFHKSAAQLEKTYDKPSDTSKRNNTQYVTKLEKSALAAPDYLVEDFEKLKEKAEFKHDAKLYLTSIYADNAITDGKNIYLGTELVQNFPRAELNAIIAHEMGHIASQDMTYLPQLQTPLVFGIALCPIFTLSILAQSLTSSTDPMTDSFKIGATVAEVIVLAASVCSLKQQQEFEADAFAAELSNQKSLTDAFKRLKVERHPPLFKKMLPPFLQTHPPLDKRIEAIKKMDDMQTLDHAMN